MDLAKLVQQAFAAVDSNVAGAVKTVTYHQMVADGEYDPYTGKTINSTADHTVPKAILTGLKFTERNNAQRLLEAGDQKLLIPYADLPITPSLKDTVTINGELWQVIDYRPDPTQSALHTFYVRRA